MENCVRVSAGDVRVWPARKSLTWLAVPEMTAYLLPLGDRYARFRLERGVQNRKPGFPTCWNAGCARMACLQSLNLHLGGRRTMTQSISTQPTVYHLVPPETRVEKNGAGPAYELGALAGKPVMIVLRITEIIEQESLHVSIWGSPDGKEWGREALFWYPQKFYQGVSPAALDLTQLPQVKFLRANWEVNRWGRGDPRPLFKFGVEIQAL